MLSNKMTFSLVSLVMLLAFGLFYVVLSVMAHDVADETTLTAAEMTELDSLHVWFSVDESVQDVSSDEGVQIASSRTRANRDIQELTDEQVAAGAGRIIVLVTFEQDVHLQILDPTTLAALIEAADDFQAEAGGIFEGLPAVSTDPATQALIDFISSGAAFGADDVVVDAFDNDGRNLGTRTLAEVLIRRYDEDNVNVFTDESALLIKHKNPAGRVPGERPGREFLIQIDQSELENVYAPQGRGGGVAPEEGLEIHRLYFSIAPGLVEEAGQAAIVRQRTGLHIHLNTYSSVLGNDDPNPLRVDLVDDDEGDPNYDQIRGLSLISTYGEDPGAGEKRDPDGVPGVVYITAPDIVVRGAYYAHILLTEQPHDNTFTVMVDGGQGTAGDPEWLKAVAPAEVMMDTIPGNYEAEHGWDTAHADAGDDSGTYDTGAYDEAVRAYDDAGAAQADDTIPQATGRDNMYHLYRVQVTPAAGTTGNITVSVAQFDDKVLPLPNTYLPLSIQQRRATTFVDAVEAARATRIMNEREALTLPFVASGIAAAPDNAYQASQDIVDANPNTVLLGAKLVIPANGYLVLTADVDAAGITASDAKIKGKKTAASKDYNTTGLGLPFPAADLDTFFRNGGTLSLVQIDIPAASPPATTPNDYTKALDEAKPSTTKTERNAAGAEIVVVDKAHDDYTGYDGAATKQYVAGSVIINEIMWGLDAGGTGSQYIELHNTTATAIGIDKNEWALVVGAAPTHFSTGVIDSVNNNPSTGYWAAPGSSGVTKASQIYPSLIDIVSMSRVTEGTDGTAAASWAKSMRPSQNLSGRRVGTPGAANSYVVAPVAPPTAPTDPPADAAKAADIMITEVMVASNNGRLPQWIELANVSGAEVSLTGWTLIIDNDPADADVVGASIEIDLGDTEIGKDQVALVVSKSSARNSGVGTGAAAKSTLREERIINVQSQVSPDDARYSILSEMGFMISLMPPQTGAVKKYGDRGGNLGKGWDVPMAESGRSSLIRREMGKTAEIMGTDVAGWVLASDTTLGGAYVTTFYGDDDDVGTPGYNAGGALPVELSKFGAKRDPLSGQVTVTWETQSELNNAGFYIKRSQQQDGEFVIVNPTMIAGAGTTSEKQSYSYADTTAQPNIVYYYQIEDVSLDGNRQTLTRAHRLKGHIGAIGKLTTLWGELKEQE